ncbi:uncharacterized protein lcorl isoform X2 [Alosa sapidissima]|uniref:uncharacterized protein lcorl isoform X2 n=1 Tax=Alosa sapidissima TaxID=34773 RepID=UPI001C099D2F|nr:uncharacterized protein lcorl isoform X2 [Alosa sapidissima]
MATQCRSSKCTAERKGFRRELDSWRHKLIHCVGFESILEGIYGPRFLRDLSIFEDCEPDAVDDWSEDARCSFCNLQLEKLSDHNPTVASPQSPPCPDSPPPQGQSNTEKIQCQADRFLNSVFCKKDFPQSCDSNIPHVAQELMRKMIHQFAVEYASKSQQEGKNGFSVDSVISAHCSLPDRPDEDGPLDLTVSRSHLDMDQDGVLDLSRKKTGGSSSASSPKASGSMKTHEDKVQEVENTDTSWIKSEDRSTILEMVLSSLCSYHKRLLSCILKFVYEDYMVSLGLRDPHRRTPSSESMCCPNGRKVCEGGGGCACCLRSCQLTTCPVTSVCVCLKNLHGLSCPSVTLSCIKKVCTSCAVCHSHHETLSCTYQACRDHSCFTHIKTMGSMATQTRHLPVPLNIQEGRRSPSPPPLSPKPMDTDLKMTESHFLNQTLECKPICMQPPFLEEETNDFLHSVKTDQAAVCMDDELQLDLKGDIKKPLEEHGSLMGDLIDRITEKLKSITPQEEENVMSGSQSPESKDDVHLKEIITTVLHSSKENDYDLDELLQQHESNKSRSPQTRSRSRQETLAAMSISPDQPSVRRQNLQIKMDIARLTPPVCKRRLSMQKKKPAQSAQCNPAPLSHSEMQFPPRLEVEVPKETDQQMQETTQDNHAPMKPDIDICDHATERHNYEEKESPPSEIELCKQSTGTKQKKSRDELKYLPKIDTAEPTRSRRNIVPPQRFSSYVTEPRQMYFAACFSENIFIRRTPKDNALKKVSSTAELQENTSRKITDQEVSSPKSGTENRPNVKLSSDNELTATTPPIKQLQHFPEQKETKHSCPSQTSETEEAGGPNLTRPSRKCKTLFNRSPEKQPSIVQTESPEKDVSADDSIDVNADELNTKSQKCPSAIQYTSPIKLMFVSPVIGEEGLRYTLKSATAGHLKGEVFDPCEESSWGRPNGVTENTQDIVYQSASPKPVENERDKNTSPKSILASDIATLSAPSNTEAHNREVTPVKRRPGRPKKLGPQIQKPAKRPIGRPPKRKMLDPGGVISTDADKSVKDKTIATSCDEESSSKNLKITVVYGRSRRSRRLVSESHVQTEHVNEAFHFGKHSDDSTKNLFIDSVEKNGIDADSLTEMPIDQEELNFVRPVKERKCMPHSSSHIKCQKQNSTMAIRKPGRPPKVKISGISVTVTTVSPRQRKIHMNREMKESPPRRRSLFSEYNTPKQPKKIIEKGEQRKEIVAVSGQESTEVKAPGIAVRHSVRERKPSIYLLHSVATSRSLSHSNALLRRSRKVLLNKANSENKKHGNFNGTTEDALSIKPPVKTVDNLQDLSQFSAVSVDSIFTSNEPLKWWPTSASPKTLNEEFERRIKLMSNTWISGLTETNNGDFKTRMSSRANGSKKMPVSAVQMLFERHYNMDKLCAWFMQTTETQSLAIVKKTSARNPYEIMHYNPMRVSNRTNVCPSPQAERLRKHVKKFAKVFPKSPKMHQQAQEIMCNRLQAKHLPLKRLLGKTSTGTQNECVKPGETTWGQYRATLHRVRSKFNTKTRRRCHRKTPSDSVTESEVSCVLQPTVEQGSAPPQTLDTLTSLDERMNTPGTLTKEERISSKAWSPESLKECRVFLKKINSPDNELTAEECNICTVEPCNVLPSRYSTTAEHKELESADAAKGGRARCPSSELKSHSFQKESQMSDRGVRSGKHKSLSASASPPAKAARQSRSSRGLSAAKWGDFVLGNYLSKTLIQANRALNGKRA